MKEGFIKIVGKKKGPISVILAGTHGNEKCGIRAFKKILPDIKIEKGRVWFGYGNPRAIKENKRFIESDLNRMFKLDDLLSKIEKKSYEYKRAKFLGKYLNKVGALLDIHASRTPGSKPFVICEANAKKIIKYLPVKLIVSGFDRVEPGGVDYYMNKTGKIGICAECGYFEDIKSTLTAQKVILAFLKARGHIANNLQPQKKSYIRLFDSYITKTKNFTLNKPFGDFEKVTKGQIIGFDGGKEARAPKTGVILFARNRKRIGEEGFLLGEKKNSLA
jgi:succinylglutamate desuccinylase